MIAIPHGTSRSGFIKNADQMGCTMATMIVVVQTIIGMVVILACHQIYHHCVMAHHRLGVVIPGKGKPGADIGQQ